MNITLHVSAITERYLSRRYMKSADTLPPYPISRNDEFFWHLQHLPMREHKLSSYSDEELLSKRIDLDVPKRLHRRLNANRRYKRIGLHLHRVVYAKLIDFVFAQRLAGEPAQKALKMFLNYYNVDETEFSLDSAYQAWKRYKRNFLPKMEAKNLNFWGYAVPQKRHDFKSTISIPKESLLDTVMEKFMGTDVDQIYVNKLASYLMYNYAQMTLNEIADFFDCSYVNVHFYVHEVEFQRDFYPDVKRDVNALERNLRVQRANGKIKKAAIIAT